MEQKQESLSLAAVVAGQKRALEGNQDPDPANKNHKNGFIDAQTGQDTRYAAHFMALAAMGVSIPRQQPEHKNSDSYFYGYLASTIKSNDLGIRQYANIASESYRISGSAPANVELLTGRIFRVKATTLTKANTNAGGMTSSIAWSDISLLEGTDLPKIPHRDIACFPKAYGTVTYPKGKEGPHVQVQEFPAANTGTWRNTRGCVLPAGTLKGPGNETNVASLLKGESVSFQVGVTATGSPIAFNVRRVTLLDQLNKVEGVDDPVESIKEKSLRLQREVDKHFTNKVYRATASGTLREHQKQVAQKPYILVQSSPSPLDQLGTHTITVGDLNRTARQLGRKNWSSLTMDEIVQSYHNKLQAHDIQTRMNGSESNMADAFQSHFATHSKSLSIIFDIDASKNDQFSSMAYAATRSSFAKVGSAGHKHVDDVIITKRIERALPGMVAATNGGGCFSQTSCPALHSVHLDPAGYNLQVVQYDATADDGLTSPAQVGSLHAYVALIKFTAEAIGAPTTEHALGNQRSGIPLGQKMLSDATKITVLYKSDKSEQSSNSTRIKHVIEDMLKKGMVRQTYNFLDDRYLVFQTLKRITLVPSPPARQEVISRLLKVGASVSAERDIGKRGVTLRTRNGIPLPKEALTRRGLQTTMLDKFSFRFTTQDPETSTESILEALGIEVSKEGQSITYAAKGNSPWGEIIVGEHNTLLGVPTNAKEESAADTVYVQGFTDTYGPEAVRHFIEKTLLRDTNAQCSIIDSLDEMSEPTSNGVYVRFLHRLTGAPGVHNEQYTMAITRRSDAGNQDTLLQLLKASVVYTEDRTNGQYKHQLKGLHWLKVHSQVPSLAMSQPQQFEQDASDHEMEDHESDWVDNNGRNKSTRSSNHSANGARGNGYRDLLFEEKKGENNSKTRGADEGDFPVNDTIIGAWLDKKKENWNNGNRPNPKQLRRLHKDLVTIYSWYDPNYHKAGADKTPMKFTASGNTLGYQIDRAFTNGVHLNTILSKVTNHTLKCSGPNANKVASLLAQELRLTADAQAKRNNGKRQRPQRGAHNNQAGVLSDTELAEYTDDFSTMEAVTADTIDLTGLSDQQQEVDKSGGRITTYFARKADKTRLSSQGTDANNVGADVGQREEKEATASKDQTGHASTAPATPSTGSPADKRTGRSPKERQGKTATANTPTQHPSTDPASAAQDT